MSGHAIAVLSWSMVNRQPFFNKNGYKQTHLSLKRHHLMPHLHRSMLHELILESKPLLTMRIILLKEIVSIHEMWNYCNIKLGLSRRCFVAFVTQDLFVPTTN